MKKFLFIENNFSGQAKAMRLAFDSRFENPKDTKANRFVWDFWHVPDQYTLLRTPADQFFPKNIYNHFLQELGAWGRENLGCFSITPPWLSNYIEGCQQQLHSDVPHGPWAFVFSLSPSKPCFKGGETLLLKPDVLNYWQGFSEADDRELNSFVERIKPSFNRLVVFDPRIPHGVTRVSGTMDPREGRLVLHGWFTDPRPYLTGSLDAKSVAPFLDEGVSQFCERIFALSEWHGVLSIRFFIKKNQEPKMKILANTLISRDGISISRIETVLRESFLKKWPKKMGSGEITLPLLFR